MGTTFSSDGNDVLTNQSIKPKQPTKPPPKDANRPPAIPPTVFKQRGAGEGEGYAVNEEWERMFEEFWAAYPDRCPRKVDRAKCRQKKAAAKRTYDWTLCAERCSNCGGDSCRVGIKVPPNYSEWASPPEECRYFRAAS